MTLKKCTCGKMQTTKNAKFIGVGFLKSKVLFFNCTRCNSTFIIGGKIVEKILQTLRKCS